MNCKSFKQSGHAPLSHVRLVQHASRRIKPSHVARRQRASVAVGAVATEVAPERFLLRNGVADFYAVLQVDDDADVREIKAAYRSLAKVCHPDFTGDSGHNLCILLNEAYETLSNPAARAAYDAQLEVALQDEEDGYTGEILSKWMPDMRPAWSKNEDPNESRAVFVDEQSCIGCKNCVWCAPATFRMESHHGRSRVFAQWLNTEEDLTVAIESCPVDCIHWVDKAELPALEYVCQKQQQRVNVATMMSQQSSRGDDVFEATRKFLRDRANLEERRRKAAGAVSPMQEAARQDAAEELARKRAGWFGAFSFTLSQSLSAAAAGYQRPAGGAPVGERERVGSRRRAVRWDGAYSSSDSDSEERGQTVPLERALVLSSSSSGDEL